MEQISWYFPAQEVGYSRLPFACVQVSQENWNPVQISSFMNTQAGEQVLMYYGEAVPLTSKNRSLKQALLIQFSNHIPP